MVFNAGISRLNWDCRDNHVGKRLLVAQMNRDFSRKRRISKIPSACFSARPSSAAGFSFLFQNGEPQTKAQNQRHYSHGRATTS